MTDDVDSIDVNVARLALRLLLAQADPCVRHAAQFAIQCAAADVVGKAASEALEEATDASNKMVSAIMQ